MKTASFLLEGLASSCFLTHGEQWKVLLLLKKSPWHLNSWCVLLFEKSQNKKGMVKVMQLLKAAEEKHVKRYKCYKVPGCCLDHKHPFEKVVYTDYFSKRKQWKISQLEMWDKEAEHLEETDGANMDVLSPACKEGQLLSVSCSQRGPLNVFCKIIIFCVNKLV
uniref:Uncharacterized protein n=1 Tax=Apteryx owenii TaxID=8824 RepID=A0A8B9NZ32_APTOW